jgi:hypothetical protein
MSTPPPVPSHPPQSIPNYMVWSILITVAALCLCCVVGAIPGIVAIVYSSQVNSKLNAGDLAGAGEASRNARLWCWITTALCILSLLLNIAWVVTGGAAQYMEMMQQLQHTQSVQHP